MEIAALQENDPKTLRAIAGKLLEIAATGEGWAIKELVDRTDGKAVQQLDVDANVSFEDVLAQL